MTIGYKRRERREGCGLFANEMCELQLLLHPPSPPSLPSFHVGTVSFGALIIAIIQLIRAILTYVQKKLKDQPSNPQLKALVQGLLCLCQCCLWCLEKFLKYINRQVYIMVGLVHVIVM